MKNTRAKSTYATYTCMAPNTTSGDVERTGLAAGSGWSASALDGARGHDVQIGRECGEVERRALDGLSVEVVAAGGGGMENMAVMVGVVGR